MRSIVIPTLAILIATTCDAAGLSGEWIAEITSPLSEPQYARVVLTSDAGKLTGTWGDARIEGTTTPASLKLTLTSASGSPMGTLTATPKGDEFAGTGTLAIARRFGGGARNAAEPQKVTFKLCKPPAAPANPKTWQFEPKQFYPYYSAKNPPALHIFPGDTVRTWTVDAGGLSPKMERLARGADAVTGPFYVEGALPGDTLVVKLNKVRINREQARQGSRINAHAVTAAYTASADYQNDFNSEWILDKEKLIAHMAHPTERMKNFTVPIKPMIGCLAVAPQGDEVYRGTDLGNFGGNMDYNGNGEGTTLYFPVFHPGGLFMLGDAHAAMGDGELTGSALETSMDVEFTVNVIKGFATVAPRAEDSDYLISFGIAGSVPEALQNATTQLIGWLKKDYRLNDNEVAVLLGAVLKYEITELVDPKFNVVAKVPKTAVAQLR